MNLHQIKKFVYALFFLAIFSPYLTVDAAWPNATEVLEEIAPLTGISPDQIEATKFYISNPECSNKIFGYTTAGDYSLVGFIGALKGAKLETLAKLGLPKLDKATCKKYNPVEQAYIFINTQGDKLLGKKQADFLRNLLEEQMKSGKEELDAQIASIPYVGTILTNWDCGCDAAFDTNFAIEQLTDKTVGSIIGVLVDVNKGNYGSALEKMVTAFGPQIACEAGSNWFGVSKIPVVSDVAAKACGSVAGKAMDFVISGAGSIAETLGIIGGNAISLEDYYKQMYRPNIGNYDYVEYSSILSGKCYNYYEKSNMSASTARKACTALTDRYIRDSLGSIEHAKFYGERYSYYTKNYLPFIQSVATYDNKEFATAMAGLNLSCESYFSLKYPNLKAYEKTYSSNLSSYDPKFCDFEYSIQDARKSAQNNLLYAVNSSLPPFCKTSSKEKNVILCEADSINSCKDALPKTCSGANGSEFPCCKIGKGTDSTWDLNVKYADQVAKEVGGNIYCSTEKKNPLKITCSLESSYKSCQGKFQWENNRDCTKASTANGVISEICCAFDVKKLASVPGVSDAATFVKEQIKKSPGSCSIGGMLEGYSFDPRIIACSKKSQPACKKKFPNACVKNSAGFVVGVCCEGYAFEGQEWQYDPTTRLKDHIALAKNVVNDSKGDCIAATTKNGEKDDFHIMCKSDAGITACKQKLDRLAIGSCSDKMTVSGFVSGPCCSKDAPRDLLEQSQKKKNLTAPKDVTLKTLAPTTGAVTNKKTAKPKQSQKKKSTLSGEIRSFVR